MSCRPEALECIRLGKAGELVVCLYKTVSCAYPLCMRSHPFLNLSYSALNFFPTNDALAVSHTNPGYKKLHVCYCRIPETQQGKALSPCVSAGTIMSLHVPLSLHGGAEDWAVNVPGVVEGLEQGQGKLSFAKGPISSRTICQGLYASGGEDQS